jgi:hypothetical protein
MRCEAEARLLAHIRHLLRKNAWANGGAMRGATSVKPRTALGIRETELANL